MQALAVDVTEHRRHRSFIASASTASQHPFHDVLAEMLDLFCGESAAFRLAVSKLSRDLPASCDLIAKNASAGPAVSAIITPWRARAEYEVTGH